jgi:cytochrome c
MVKKVLQITLFFLILITVVGFMSKESRISKYVADKPTNVPTSVEEALVQLGEKKPLHYLASADKDSARMGEEIVKYGQLLDKSNTRVSKFFVCTDCHNVQLESADPADVSPEAVLEHSKKNKIPFLPASTFYGMFNKRHWYNDDYSKKYGDLVIPTRDTLVNAIQLCATQCSQGRAMEKWEIRAVLHYYKTLELKISDLKFDQKEWDNFSSLLITDKNKAVEMLKSKYTELNHAHFGTSAIPKIDGYVPNAENGQYIFEGGCLHCHDAEAGITNFKMSNDPLTLNFLRRKKDKYNHFAVPHITRYGTYAITGRKQYMPMYSLDKMSDKQMLDLLHYIEVGGVKK